MRSGVVFFCLLVALPALAVLGHDMYFAYLDMEAGKPDPFRLSALGWFWTNYSADTFEYTRDFIEEDTWINKVDPILKEKALYVFGAVAGVFYVLLLALKLLNQWPFNDGSKSIYSKSGGGFTYDADLKASKTTQKGLKYKRK